MSDKKEKRIKRHSKIRAGIKGTADRPRLAVFRSNQHVYAQLVDDEKHRTLLFVSDLKIPASVKSEMERAGMVGEKLAAAAIEKKITSVVFDRGGFAYHGRVKAVAEGARKGGLKF